MANHSENNPLKDKRSQFEEKSGNSGQGGIHTTHRPKQSTDALNTPDAYAGELDSLEDFLLEEGGQSPPPDTRSIAHARISHPEVHNPLRQSPEMSTQADMPETLATGILPHASIPRLRPAPVIFLALIGMAGLATITSMDLELSHHIDQLESQHSIYRRKITSINQRIHKLEATISSLEVTVSTVVLPVSHQIPDIVLPDQSLPPLDTTGHH